MNFYSNPDFDRHEQVVFFHDTASGLKAIVAIHNTTLGPALGGTRMYPYTSDEAALTDVLRLSHGMSYKSAMAGLKLGGGKSVIIGDPRTEKTPEKLAAFGRSLERLGGLYIAAEDSGTSGDDLRIVAQYTNHVSGVADKQDPDGNISKGDPSPSTSYGMFVGMRAAIEHQFNTSDFTGLRVAIQGMGHVGKDLARRLHEAGAKLVVADLQREPLEEARSLWGAEIVSGNEILYQDVDIVAPCAMGAILTKDSIVHIKAPIIAGCSNNQLATPDIGARLHEMGKLYAPDYVINAGGVIDVYHEKIGYDPVAVKKDLDNVYTTLKSIFERSAEQNLPTSVVADMMAEEQLGLR